MQSSQRKAGRQSYTETTEGAESTEKDRERQRRGRCVLGEMVGRGAAFLDRDGTICEDVGYLNHVSQLRIFPFAAGAIRALNEAGLAVVVVTNQSGVARKYFSETAVQEVHEVLVRELAAAGAKIDGIYYCPHTDADGCDCRKPKPGMLTRASGEHGLNLARSFVVGDRLGDIELGRAVGARSILVRTGNGENELASNAASWAVQPDFVAPTLTEAAEWIVEQAK
jgi:D-glycero-D-manno-heptose 1,7-bisphosphate phosphatase